MIKLKTLLLESRLKSVSVLTEENLTKIVLAAQKQYDQWNQDEEGYDEELGSGGICHLIAEEIVDVLYKLGIESTTTCSSFEQHVYVISKFKEGIYSIDIPYHSYETGGGYTWKKRPNVKFDTSHISIDKLDNNPRNFKKYAGDGYLGENSEIHPQLKLQEKVKRFELELEKRFPQLESLNLYMKSMDNLYLDSIRIKDGERGKGIGHIIMTEITKFADENNLILTLHASPEKGYKKKLYSFYKEFGFTPNKGRKMDFQFSHPFYLVFVRRPNRKNKKLLDEETFHLLGSTFDIDKAILLIKKKNIQPISFNIKEYAEKVLGLDRNKPDHKPQSFMAYIDYDYLEKIPEDRLKQAGIIAQIKTPDKKVYTLVIDGNHRLAKNYMKGVDTMMMYPLDVKDTNKIKM